MRFTRTAPLGAGLVLLCFAGGRATARPAPAMEIAVADGAFSDLQQGDPMRTLAFQRAKDLGASHIRGFLEWHTTPNHVYDDSNGWYNRFDSTVNEARSNGIEVQLSLCGQASQSDGPDRTGVNPDPGEYAKFCAGAARFFKGRVHRYSIWNEPNSHYFLRVTGVVNALGHVADGYTDADRKASAERYREMVLAGYRAIKAVDPSAEVLIGELSSGHDPVEFFEDVAPEGTHLVADGFALHPYQFKLDPTTKGNAKGLGGGISQVKEWQALLAKLAKEGRATTPGGGKLPLFLTEFGYEPDRPAGPQSVQLDEATRAKWLPEAFEVALEAGAKQMLYFQLLPPDPNTAWDTSLVDRNGNPRASFIALETWAFEHGYPAKAPPGVAATPPAATPSPGDGLPAPPKKRKGAKGGHVVD